MRFLNLDHVRDYFNRYSNLSHVKYSKYFAFCSVSPLFNTLLDDNYHGTTWWTNKVKSNYAEKLVSQFVSDDDVKFIKSILRHGNYSTEFLRRYFSKKVKPLLILNDPLYHELLSEYNRINKGNLSLKLGYDGIVDDLMGCSLLTILDDTDKLILIRSIEEFYANQRKCEICGNEYKVIFFPTWLYFRVNGNIQICYECDIPKPTKSGMEAAIRELVDFIGFIPNSGFQLFKDNSFSVRIPSEKWVQAFRYTVQLGAGQDKINEKFGSWFKALVAAGVLDNNQLVTKRGVRCLAKSGNECNSLDEQYIDNLLYQQGYSYKKEPRYPVHPKFNPKGLMRADWIVNSKYVEYFGLKGNVEYDNKTALKFKLCQEVGIELVAIYPEDLRNPIDVIKKLTF